MTIFQNTSIYATELALNFDEERQRYIGEFTSVGGVYRFEGVNRADITYEMERLLREEHRIMERDTVRRGSYSRSRGGGISRGGGSTSAAPVVGRERGLKVHTINVDERSKVERNPSLLSRSGTWVDLVTGGIALSTGDLMDAAVAGVSLTFGEWADNIESWWDRSVEQKIFAVTFCGIVITAASRRQLRRKLLRKKNQRIQKIMNHLIKNGLANGDSDYSSYNVKVKRDGVRRLQKKKKKAADFARSNWKSRVSPQGQETGWRARTKNLRDRVKDKKEASKDMWVRKI